MTDPNGWIGAATRDDIAAVPPEQARRELASRLAYEAVEEIEQLAERVRRCGNDIERLAGCHDIAAVIGTAADRLTAVQRELRQGAHFGGHQPRMF